MKPLPFLWFIQRALILCESVIITNVTSKTCAVTVAAKLEAHNYTMNVFVQYTAALQFPFTGFKGPKPVPA